VAGAIYQRGKFAHADTLIVWAILAGSGVGLLASTQGRLYASAFYALKDTRTPLRFAVLRVLLTTVFGYLCSKPLPAMLGIDPKWAVAGLTASAGVSGWVEFILLRRALAERIGTDPTDFGYLARLWTSALTAAGIAWAIKFWSGGTWHPIPLAIATLIPFGIFYLLVASPAQLRQMIRR
jgi:putative peptidoglycan lipid II flippase